MVALAGVAEELKLDAAVTFFLKVRDIAVVDGGNITAAVGVGGVTHDVNGAVRGDGDGGGAVIAVGWAVVTDDPLLVTVGVVFDGGKVVPCAGICGYACDIDVGETIKCLSLIHISEPTRQA